MKIYKFNELELFEKPNVIKIIGAGHSNKHLLSNKLLVSYHDKNKLKQNTQSITNLTNVDKFGLTIFTNQLIHYFPNHIYNISQHYITDGGLKDFYLIRKYHIKKKF